MLSRTLTRRGAHCLPAWCDAVKRFINDYCEAGGVALERGKRNEWLHCQMILRLHWDPNDLQSLKAVVKNYCGIQRGDGLHAVIECHVFGAGQQWSTMIGYIHKDRLKPHFRVLMKNVSDEEVEEVSDAFEP